MLHLFFTSPIFQFLIISSILSIIIPLLPDFRCLHGAVRFLILICATEFLSPLLGEKEDISLHHKNIIPVEREEGEFPRENGQLKSNGIEMETKSEKSSERQPDVVDDHPDKSRSTLHFFALEFLFVL